MDPVDAVGGVPSRRGDEPTREPFLAPQIRFGQRRAAKWHARLVADEGEGTVVPLLAKGASGVPARHAGSDDDDPGDQPNVKQKASTPGSRNSISNRRSVIGFG